MNKNKMKEKLLSGKPAFGVSVMIPSPQVVEMIGRLGFDWVLLDCEHGTLALESLELMIMAAEASGITPIVRPEAKDPNVILRVMDRGALGVQVPHVNTAADARHVVQSVKFHPLGNRGLAAGTRPSNYGFGPFCPNLWDTPDRQMPLKCGQRLITPSPLLLLRARRQERQGVLRQSHTT
jgi:4-hydroxy-2-oxoheptanedioate aldolase